MLVFTESRSDLFDPTYKRLCNEQLHDVKSILALTLGWVNHGKGAWESDNFDYLTRSIQLAVMSEEWPDPKPSPDSNPDRRHVGGMAGRYDAHGAGLRCGA